jgi:cation:H+ antiporter
MSLISSLLLAVVALVILAFSADKFVELAGRIAKSVGIPSFVIGALILGFGTSAPEMIVSVLSALEEAPELAFGNAIGSNITNLALVLGVTLLFGSISIQPQVLKRDMSLLLLISVFMIYLLWDLRLSAIEGYVLMLLLVGYVALSLYRSEQDPAIKELDEQLEAEQPAAERSRLAGSFIMIFWLALMLISSQMLVTGAVSIATTLNVSELIIGLTVVAVGTSMPELVASVAAARRGDQQMALGNIVGSNIFNTLGVVGLAVAVQPFGVPQLALDRDMVLCTLLTLAVLAISAVAYKRGKSLGKLTGVALLSAFVGYTTLLVVTAA